MNIQTACQLMLNRVSAIYPKRDISSPLSVFVTPENISQVSHCFAWSVCEMFWRKINGRFSIFFSCSMETTIANIFLLNYFTDHNLSCAFHRQKLFVLHWGKVCFALLRGSCLKWARQTNKTISLNQTPNPGQITRDLWQILLAKNFMRGSLKWNPRT